MLERETDSQIILYGDQYVEGHRGVDSTSTSAIFHRP